METWFHWTSLQRNCVYIAHMGVKKKYDFVVQCTTKLCFYCLLGGEKVEQQKYDFVIHWRYNYVVYFNGVIFWLLNFFPKYLPPFTELLDNKSSTQLTKKLSQTKASSNLFLTLIKKTPMVQPHTHIGVWCHRRAQAQRHRFGQGWDHRKKWIGAWVQHFRSSNSHHSL